MLGTPKDLKAFNIGTLESLGLGRMTPFVKLGLDSMGGKFQELDEKIADLVTGIDMDIGAGASQLPPLGRFQNASKVATPLSSRRLTELLRLFNGLIGKSGGPNGQSGFDALRKVFGTVNLLHRTFSDYRQFSKDAANSTFSNLRM